MFGREVIPVGTPTSSPALTSASRARVAAVRSVRARLGTRAAVAIARGAYALRVACGRDLRARAECGDGRRREPRRSRLTDRIVRALCIVNPAAGGRHSPLADLPK